MSKEGFRALIKLAEQGNDAAQNALGDNFYDGIGVYANRQTAIDWYKKAAAKDVEKAKEALTRLGVR